MKNVNSNSSKQARYFLIFSLVIAQIFSIYFVDGRFGLMTYFVTSLLIIPLTYLSKNFKEILVNAAAIALPIPIIISSILLINFVAGFFWGESSIPIDTLAVSSLILTAMFLVPTALYTAVGILFKFTVSRVKQI